MSNVIFVGDWLESLDGVRSQVVLDLETCSDFEGGNPMIAITRNGDTLTLPRELPSWLRILPNCDGWDWAERKWRPARFSDLVQAGTLQCRVRDSENEEWAHCALLGYGGDDDFPWLVGIPGGTRPPVRYAQCEVFDDAT